jgi:hypothetical protein
MMNSATPPLLEELVSALGEAQVLTGERIVDKYKSDWIQREFSTPAAALIDIGKPVAGMDRLRLQ